MKILLVSRRSYPEVIGGGQLSAHHIARALVDAGHDVRVLTFVTDGKRVDEVLDNVMITRLLIRELRWFPRFSNLEWMYHEMRRQTARFLSEFTPDVIHALNGESVPAIAPLARRRNIPWVATVNGPWLFCFPGEGTDGKGENCIGCHGKKRFHETMLKWGNKGLLSKIKAFLYWLYSYPHMRLLRTTTFQATRLIAVSNAWRDELSKLGAPSERIAVVPNPMDVHTKANSKAKQQLNIPQQAPVLFFAGRFTESKGVQQTIRALVKLPDAHFIVAGKGPYESNLRALAKQLLVEQRVHFIGFLPNEQLAPYYSIADVVLMPGTFYESLGRMLLEACSYGIPVIATNRAGNPDIITHGVNGYLLETQDVDELVQRITDIIRHPARAKTMGAAARQKIIVEFAPARIARELTDAYRDAIAARRH